MTVETHHVKAVLTGQVSVVTGAGRGIGAAIATKLAQLGSTVVLCGRSSEPLASVVTKIAKLAGKSELKECDVTDLSSVEQLAGFVRERFGRVDVLVNNAGIGAVGAPLHEMTAEAWDAVLNTNLRGVFYCIRSFAPMMIEAGSGHIINISSLAGKNPLPNGAAYSASKWGLNGLTYSVAEELRGYGIRVSVICPGSVATEFGGPRPRRNSDKMLKPEDVAHAVAMIVTQAPQSFASEILLRPAQKP